MPTVTATIVIAQGIAVVFAVIAIVLSYHKNYPLAMKSWRTAFIWQAVAWTWTLSL